MMDDYLLGITIWMVLNIIQNGDISGHRRMQTCISLSIPDVRAAFYVCIILLESVTDCIRCELIYIQSIIR